MNFLKNFFSGGSESVTAPAAETQEASFSKEKLVRALIEWKNSLPDTGGISNDYQGGGYNAPKEKMDRVIEQISNLQSDEVEEAYKEANLDEVQTAGIKFELFERQKSQNK